MLSRPDADRERTSGNAWFDFWKNPEHTGRKETYTLRRGANQVVVRVRNGEFASGGFFARLEGPKPDFSGTWKFQPERSSLQIASPESSMFVIDHQEPQWRLVRTHVLAGIEDTLTIKLTTDGTPTVSTRRGFEVHSRLSWEGDSLVFDSTHTRKSDDSLLSDSAPEKLTNVVRYRLTDEGRTLIAEEHLRGKRYSHENIWVFAKQ